MLLGKAIALVIVFRHASSVEDTPSQSAALHFLEDYEKAAEAMCKDVMSASWNYMTNLTEENKQKMLEAQMREVNFGKLTSKAASSYAWHDLEDKYPVAFQQFMILSQMTENDVPNDISYQLQSVIADMTEIYSKAKVCDPRYPCTEPQLELDPDILVLMSYLVDDEQLKRIWVEWHDATGKKIRKLFLRYVELKNKVAQINGFHDAGDLWLSQFQYSTFKDNIAKLWQDIEPFYQQLHAYTRKKLIPYYSKLINHDGPLPAHLLGSLWSADWLPLYSLLKPYSEVATTDVTRSMIKKGVTRIQMYQAADEFFTSLGLLPVTAEFWNNSLLEKPTDRNVLCHPSAWDFCDGKDVRINICTNVSESDFIAIHHEMGHIQYYMQYADQPYLFRESANPGFHEAIGDAIAFSVSTPAHLKKIGFIEDFNDSPAADLNFLMKMALDKIAFLPFGYIVDLWRWSVFNGTISESNINTRWWEMSLKYQGICPPVKRTEDDLDAATLLHIVSDIPYIRYFVSSIIQFQIHKSLCKEAGYEGLLHKCDIHESTKAGKLLSELMSKGRSITYSEAMLIITKGETNKMDAKGLLEYFEPLFHWLKVQNQGETISWSSDDATKCP